MRQKPRSLDQHSSAVSSVDGSEEDDDAIAVELSELSSYASTPELSRGSTEELEDERCRQFCAEELRASSCSSSQQLRNTYPAAVDPVAKQLQWNFSIMCMDPLEPEALLKRLVQEEGKRKNVFLPPDEACGFHIETRELEMQLIKRQELKSRGGVDRLTYGSRGAVVSFSLALGIVLCGVLLITLTGWKDSEMLLPYNSNATSISFTLDEEYLARSGKKQVALAFVIGNFISSYRTYFASRSKELGGSYRCLDEQKTVKDLLEMRPRWSLKNFAKLPTDEQTVLFPCGAASFAVFNDEVEIEEIPAGVHAEKIHFDPYNYVKYASAAGNGNGAAWVDVKTDRFRQWLVAPAGRRRFIPVALLRNVTAGDYTLNFTDSSWPAEFWKARKYIGIFGLGALGGAHRGLGVFICTLGVACCVAVLLLVTCCKNRRRVLSTLQLPPSVIAARIDEVAQENANTRRLVTHAMRASLRVKRGISTVAGGAPPPLSPSSS